ncbi:hypothetical protein V8F20_006217 [Naviculisporaceae sp. PSN 640]
MTVYHISFIQSVVKMRRGLRSGLQRSIIPSRSRRSSLPLYILLIAGLGGNDRSVVAQDENSQSAFTFPAAGEDGMTYYQNDTVLVSYVSSFPDPGLYAWCKDDNGQVYNVYTNSHAASFNGTQPVLIDFTTDNGECWWNLRRQFESPDGANGGVFTVADTEREGGPQTISQFRLATSSMTTLAASSTSLTGNTRQTQTGASTFTTTSSSITSTSTDTDDVSPNGNGTNPTPQQNSNDGGGLSTAAAAGIGVAVGVVVVVFLIGLIIWLRKWKSNVIAEAVKATQSGSGGSGGSGGSTFDSPATAAASLQAVGELRAGPSPVYPAYANVPTVGDPDMGQVMTTAEAPGGVKYYFPVQAPNGISRPPEEMDVERHTAEMEGDSTYGQKFQGAQYR